VNDITESILWKKGYRINSRNEWYLPPKDHSVPPAAECKRDPGHESSGKDEGKDVHAGFRVVRIKSYRQRMCDVRNLFDKHFTDCLVAAGLLVDDSPEWCRIEVEQIQVDHWRYERTEIEITD